MSVTKPIILDETGNLIVDALNNIADNIAEEKNRKIYGIRRNLSSTSSEWERIDDAVGLVANATHDGSEVVNDFDNIYPYSDIITVNYDVTNDKIVARYGDANFKFDGTNGDVMTYFPKFYISRTQDEVYETIRISKYQFEGAQEIAPFLLGRYTMATDGAYSKSGVASKASQTVTQFRTLATAKGSGWHIMDWKYFLIGYLYLVEYADANSQSVLGQGVCSVSAQVTNGQLDSLGMKSGCKANAGATSVIYRGIENPFGNLWQFMDGCNVIDNQLYMCFEPSKYAVDTTVNYQSIAKLATSNGNPNKMCYNANAKLVGMPGSVGASVYGDYYWQATGNRIAIVGGYWYNGASDGLFCFGVNGGSSLSNTFVSSRLQKDLS